MTLRIASWRRPAGQQMREVRWIRFGQLSDFTSDDYISVVKFKAEDGQPLSDP